MFQKDKKLFKKLLKIMNIFNQVEKQCLRLYKETDCARLMEKISLCSRLKCFRRKMIKESKRKQQFKKSSIACSMNTIRSSLSREKERRFKFRCKSIIRKLTCIRKPSKLWFIKSMKSQQQRLLQWAVKLTLEKFIFCGRSALKTQVKMDHREFQTSIQR